MKMPELDSMEPKAWSAAMWDFYYATADHIIATLNKYQSPQEVESALQPIFRPNVTDLDDESIVQLWIKAENDLLYIGYLEAVSPVRYYPEHGYWWYDGETLPNDSAGEFSAEDLHEIIAEHALESACLSDQYWELPVHVATESRRILGDYLSELQPLLENSQVSAETLRPALLNLLNALKRESATYDWIDQSTDPHQTHLVIKQKDRTRHILAVTPGTENLTYRDFRARFDNSPDDEILLTTDHLTFSATYTNTLQGHANDPRALNRNIYNIYSDLSSVISASSAD